MATLREKISLRIAELGIKQAKVGEWVGVQPQNMSAFLRGTRPIPYMALEKVCMILGLTLGDKDTVYNNKPTIVCSEKKSEG